jgi:hypothetical protein
MTEARRCKRLHFADGAFRLGNRRPGGVKSHDKRDSFPSECAFVLPNYGDSSDSYFTASRHFAFFMDLVDRATGIRRRVPAVGRAMPARGK